MFFPPQPGHEATAELHLRNTELEVTISPSEGGRVASLRSRRSGVEFLTQSQKPFVPVLPGLHRAFRDGPCAGIEECLPTVAASGPETSGGSAPDHGDLWQLPWHVSEPQSDTRVALHAEGFSRPLRLSKEHVLEGAILHIHYRAQNAGGAPTDFLYACHPLFAVDFLDRILLPHEVQTCRLDYSRNGRCGTPGDLLSWPGSSAFPHIDLSTASSSEVNTAEMLYTGRLQQGLCGIYRTGSRQGISVSFNTSALPYLGVWLCYGGWPDLPGYPAQHAVALEPTTAPYNSLREAQGHDSAIRLAPGESFRWSIAFRVSEPGISLKRFAHQIFGSSHNLRRPNTS